MAQDLRSFLAALKDFPAVGLNPRTVVVQMPAPGS